MEKTSSGWRKSPTMNTEREAMTCADMLSSVIPIAALFILMAGTVMTQTNDSTSTLDATQRGIVLIAAFTANGDLDKLNIALGEGLNAGLTVNEIKEILVQMYAYTGFPRS